MPLERRERIALGLVLAAALLLRLLHIHELSSDVLFARPALDEERYVSEARRLAHGGSLEPRAFWQPPGIMYALALMFHALGDGLYVPRVIAAIASTLTCALVFAIGRRLVGAKTGIAAAAVVAFHGALIFSAAEFLPATWACVFDALALYLLLDADKSPRHAAGAGVALGISAVFTPIVLPFALVAAIHLIRTAEDRRPFAAFAFGLALPILPVAYRNFDYSGQPVLISTNGGLNFFIGNNEHYFDTLATRPGFGWDDLANRAQQRGIRDPVAQSAWFRSQGIAFWTAHPWDALTLYLRKIWLFFHASEIPRDADLYAVRRDSRVLRMLVGPRPFWFPDGLLMPLAVVGLAKSLRDRKRLIVPIAFVVVQTLAVAMFFVSARYRVPSLPILALFAVIGLVAIARSVGRARLALIGATLALAVVCALPAREVKMVFAAERDFFRGLSYRGLHDTPRAIEAFRVAAERDPTDFRPWFELGASLDALGRAGEAADAWERAGAVEPSNPRPRRMAAAARMRIGDRAGAIRALEANLHAGNLTRATDHMELASIHLSSGDTAATLRALRAAKAVDPAFFSGASATFTKRYRATFDDAAFWVAVAELGPAPHQP